MSACFKPLDWKLSITAAIGNQHASLLSHLPLMEAPTSHGGLSAGGARQWYVQPLSRRRLGMACSAYGAHPCSCHRGPVAPQVGCGSSLLTVISEGQWHVAEQKGMLEIFRKFHKTHEIYKTQDRMGRKRR